MKSSKSNTGSSAKNINPSSVERIKALRKKERSVNLSSKILKGNQSALGQAITLVESNRMEDRDKASKLLKDCLPHANKSIRIGITGVPGVGKSTFIETFGNYLLSKGKKVAVLAVDPSSSLSRGSILGDKTRMEELVKKKNAFIRPSPTGNSLGGVSRKTRESIVLCEAAGFDVILIETVGVGQSETAVYGMTDFFLLLKLAGAGDELQGIKRGIMEMADCVVINKADEENKKAAKKAKTEFRRALHLYPEKENGWSPKVSLCSALYNKGVENIWEIIEEYRKHTKASGHFTKKREQQNKAWLLQIIDEELKNNFYNNPKIKTVLEKKIQEVMAHKIMPFEAAKHLLSYSQSLRKKR